MTDIKLNWQYIDAGACAGEYHTMYKGYRIRAVVDENPIDPFKDYNGHWPLWAVTGVRNYGSKLLRPSRDELLDMISSDQIVHDQRAFAKILGWETIPELMEAYVCEEPVVYCRDPEVLRDAFVQAMDDKWYANDSDLLTGMSEMLTLAGVPNLRTLSQGYSQGDWAELLVIGTPECVRRFGLDTTGWDAARWEKELCLTADLYSAWAWGDVYGYIVEKRADFLEPDDDPDDFEDSWEEIDACWGYYGEDFAESGLEGAAMEVVNG